ncbi:MAG: methyltransferase domain-containing protein, partial [Candidatus Saccharimonadales bacterium]
KHGPCLETNRAVMYRGPFKQVEDDDGHIYTRGQRTAVCDKTFRLLTHEPYAGIFEPIDPRVSVSLEAAQPFDCSRSSLRHPRETKQTGHALPIAKEDCCGASGEDCRG